MDNWQSINFLEAIHKVKIGREHQILSSEIMPSGRYPVIDQGQAFIAGYSDADSKVIREGLPVVLFGDHTRCVKYVDFPFILGADGTKVLKPKEDLFDSKFFYYTLMNLDIPNRGYNRHFTILKEKNLPHPEIAEQRKIAGVLGVVQKAIEQQEQLIQRTTELKKALLHQLFTHGLHNEPQKQTEIGPVPESWEISTIRTNAKLIAGGTPLRRNKEYWEGGAIPWVKTGEVDYHIINDTEEKITPAAVENSAAKLLPKGTLLIAMYGQGVTRGKVAILDIEATTNQACAGIIPINEKVLPLYLYYFLTFSYSRLRGLSHGAQQQNLNAELVGSFKIGFPKADQQRQIVLILQTIDRKISVHARKRSILQELFKTILHLLMTAQVRVDDLDLQDIKLITKE